LQGGLEDLEAEVAQEVAHALFALGDDVAGRGAADGVGNVLTESLEVGLQGRGKGFGGEGG